MYVNLLEYQLKAAHEQLLRDTTIDENGPGTILRDFESILSYIGEKKLPLTKTYNLPLRNVRDLNARLSNPLELGLTRPMQKSYPHLHGLYLLVRSSGLTTIEHVGKKRILELNPESYELWQSLNSTERYASLLELWITRANPELINEKSSRFGRIDNLRAALTLFSKLSEDKAQSRDIDNITSLIRYIIGDYNLGIIDSFGLVKAEFGPPKAKSGWYLNDLAPSPFGKALFSLLASKYRQAIDPFYDPEEEGNELKSLQSILQPYFPELQNSLIISSPEDGYQEGTHVFKVSLGGCWRRIAISADSDLDTFAYAILASVEFDVDHLYSFSYRDRIGMTVEINHPYIAEGELTNEVEIGTLNLYPGQIMTFLFDFGDDWEFDIKFERLATEIKVEIDEPVLLEEEGEAPVQYESWDEEEWDEEEEEEE